MNTRKSPIKQQRMKASHPISVPNTNRNGTSYTKNLNSHYRHNSHTTSPTAMSADSLPAVPLFYSNTYADPPECSSLPKPPESWYLKSNDENLSIQNEEKDTSKQKSQRRLQNKKNYYNNNNNNKGFYSPFYSTKTYEKFPTPYISVKA